MRDKLSLHAAASSSGHKRHSRKTDVRRSKSETPPVVLLARQLAYRPQIDWDAQPLGKVPVAELAERLGCKPRNVRRAMAVRGIEEVE